MKKLILSTLLILLVMGLIVANHVREQLLTLERPLALEEPILFELPVGTPFLELARMFQQRGWIQDPLWLRIHARLHPEEARPHAGTYEIEPGMSVRDILRRMASGDVKTWEIRFIEGINFREMRELLAQAEHLRQQTRDWPARRIMEALGNPDQHPEGRFFPDTYRYTARDSDLDILRRAHGRMASILAQEWQARAPELPYDSPEEALIMASIVEKETGVPEERARIAGVFVRRLEKGMRLQTDPTVIYGLGDSYAGNLRREDLREKTPYNTYRIDGLPPTPIAMPGREAIHAALHPAPGEALYFVARGDGSHVFSRTLSEHRAAVREYQIRNRRADYRSAPSESASQPDEAANE